MKEFPGSTWAVCSLVLLVLQLRNLSWDFYLNLLSCGHCFTFLPCMASCVVVQGVACEIYDKKRFVCSSELPWVHSAFPCVCVFKQLSPLVCVEGGSGGGVSNGCLLCFVCVYVFKQLSSLLLNDCPGTRTTVTGKKSSSTFHLP